VTATNPNTGISRQAVTGERDGCSIQALEAGDYTVRTEKQGFQTNVREKED
jgi:hypothetical protein